MAAWGRVAYGFSGVPPPGAAALLGGGGLPRPWGGVEGQHPAGRRGGVGGRGGWSRRGFSPPSSGSPARTPGG